MGLIKDKQAKSKADPQGVQSHGERNLDRLLQRLADPLADRRRRAALNLSGFPQAAESLCRRLSTETEATVIEAIFTSLIKMGGKAVVECVIPYLRCEDASLRNQAVEALQALPDDVGPYMELLLGDSDSDVRIFAVNILGNLHHPMAHIWLQQAVELDDNVNVCTTAVDVMAEVGTEEQIPSLQKLPGRFDDDPYVTFAVDTAIRRIRSDD